MFCQTFEKLFIFCVEIYLNLKVQLSSFEPQTLHEKLFKVRQSRHTITLTRASLFYIMIMCWKFQDLKAKCQVKISNLINYLAIKCWNGKGTAIIEIRDLIITFKGKSEEQFVLGNTTKTWCACVKWVVVFVKYGTLWWRHAGWNSKLDRTVRSIVESRKRHCYW